MFVVSNAKRRYLSSAQVFDSAHSPRERGSAAAVGALAKRRKRKEAKWAVNYSPF